MEPYRNNMGGSSNRNMSSGCNQGRQSINQMGNRGRQMNMQMNRQMGRQMDMQMNTQTAGCPRITVMPVEEACDCGDSNSHMRHMSVGIGYVPMQEWGELYDMEAAHCQGTIFPDLNLIFCGSRGKM